jgi:hypothetical protein
VICKGWLAGNIQYITAQVLKLLMRCIGLLAWQRVLHCCSTPNQGRRHIVHHRTGEAVAGCIPHHIVLGLATIAAMLERLCRLPCIKLLRALVAGQNHLLACIEELLCSVLLLLLLLLGQVSAIFGSSLEVMISVFGESPADGNVFHCAVRRLAAM